MTNREAEWDRLDYYAILGLTMGAPDEAITRQFRHLARRYHPDLNPADPTAAYTFRCVHDAYAVLRDPAARGRYDAYRRQRLARAAEPAIVDGRYVPGGRQATGPQRGAWPGRLTHPRLAAILLYLHAHGLRLWRTITVRVLCVSALLTRARRYRRAQELIGARGPRSRVAIGAALLLCGAFAFLVAPQWTPSHARPRIIARARVHSPVPTREHRSLFGVCIDLPCPPTVTPAARRPHS